MQLVMYIDEQEVDAMRIPTGSMPLDQLMNDLRKKHADRLKEGETHRFVIENMPSVINDFQSLMK